MIIHQITIQKLDPPMPDGGNFQGNLHTIGVGDSKKNNLWPTVMAVDVKTLLSGLSCCIEEAEKQWQ